MPTALAELDAPAPAPMELLAQGIPITLLWDLVLGPQSEDLMLAELAQRLPLQAAAR